MSTYTGPQTAQHDNSKMYDNSQMYNQSRMHNNSRMYNNSRMCDNSQMHAQSQMHDNSRMHDYSRMHDHSRMYDNSRIHDHSEMHDNSQMCGNSRMYGNSCMRGYGIATHPGHVVCADNVGVECTCLTVHPDTQLGLRVNRGCFTGSVADFLAAVRDKPKDDMWRDAYPELLYGLVYAVTVALERYPIEGVPMDLVHEAQAMTAKGGTR